MARQDLIEKLADRFEEQATADHIAQQVFTPADICSELIAEWYEGHGDDLATDLALALREKRHQNALAAMLNTDDDHEFRMLVLDLIRPWAYATICGEIDTVIYERSREREDV